MPKDIIQVIESIALPAILVLSMYLILYLPQKKREKVVSKMQNSLQVGDGIITYGGIVGKILNINSDEIVVETSVDKTNLKMKKWSVKEILKE